MLVGYEQIQKANESIKTTDIEGKDYAEVNQRIKAFRMCYPNGWINTEMLSNENGICIFGASCGFYDDNGECKTLGTGHAYEKEGSSFINSTSYIENCETSAVGRALGMAGFGIDTAVAGAEEVKNALENQGNQNPDSKGKGVPREGRKASPKQVEILSQYYTGENLTKLLEHNHIERIEDISMSKASELIVKLKGESQ